MKKNRLISLVLILSLTMIFSMTGCSSSSGTSDTSGSTSDAGTDTTSDSSSNTTIVSDMFTERDYETGYDESSAALITLSGDSASCSSDAVEISGTTVTIKDEGTFILSGQLDDGMIIVNAEENDKPQLVLDGVTITSETSAPIYILEADKVFITLAPDSENTLANGGTFTAIDENNIDSVIFSKQDLTLNGTGTLTVTSPAGHGIVSKDDLVFTSGSYTVNSASHGLDANDSVRIVNASLNIDAGKDGIHAENSDDESLGFTYIASGTFSIDAEGDGISTGSYMQIEDGNFDITSGGGSENASKQTSDSYGGFMGGQPGQPGSVDPGAQAAASDSSDSSSDSEGESTSIKGLKASGDMTVSGGTFTIDSADDAVHSNSSVIVNNGTFTIASGDDGFHADSALTIKDGTIDISESYEGLEALDISVEGGNIKLKASDDGLNAAGGTDSSGFGGERGGDQFGGPGGGGGRSSSNGSILISGGNLFVNASGDGIDANGSLEISGGYTVVIGPTQGDTATLDYDTTAVITGGTFIGTGAYGMAQTFSDSQQGVVAVSVGNISAGTAVSLADGDGNVLIEYTPELDYAVVILSSPEIEKGASYTITAGSASGEVQAS